MKGRIALYVRHPMCSVQCCNGMLSALYPHYSFKLFNEEQINKEFFDDIDMIAFPGGIGDADTYFGFFKRKTANHVADYIERGGRYLGICMGAYWAGPNYFDILDGIEIEQYIKQPTADIRRSFGTTADIDWQGTKQQMFFYDGCSILGDSTKFTTIGSYANGDPAAVIQGRIGLIGPHPESEKFWYNKPFLESKWHETRHHKLLLEFVDQLMEQ